MFLSDLCIRRLILYTAHALRYRDNTWTKFCLNCAHPCAIKSSPKSKADFLLVKRGRRDNWQKCTTRIFDEYKIKFKDCRNQDSIRIRVDRILKAKYIKFKRNNDKSSTTSSSSSSSSSLSSSSDSDSISSNSSDSPASNAVNLSP